MLLPQIVKCSASYRVRQDMTFIVDLVILSDTQPEDLERPQMRNTDAWVILVFRLLRLPHNVPNYLFHLRIAMEIQ
jgi:hypothetical protein